MGFLNSNEIIVDAVLTKKGRQLLSEGSPNFKITKFALSDEGVDYRLYNFNHPSGSNFYGEEIENTPMLEAMVDESMTMRYKLVTLSKGTTRMPIISATPTSILLNQSATSIITANTLNGSTGFDNSTYGFTAVLSDSRLGTLGVAKSAPSEIPAQMPTWLDDDTVQRSVAEVGLEFTFRAANISGHPDATRIGTTSSFTVSGIITIIANETGGIAEIPVTVNYIPTSIPTTAE